MGGSFILDGTVGQPQASTVSIGGTFDLRGGFWVSQNFAPTAAPASVFGRIILSAPFPVGRIRIVLVQISNGAVRVTRPSPFGFYQFDGLEVGPILFEPKARIGNLRLTRCLSICWMTSRKQIFR